jgi:hypothetical protein
VGAPPPRTASLPWSWIVLVAACATAFVVVSRTVRRARGTTTIAVSVAPALRALGVRARLDTDERRAVELDEGTTRLPTAYGKSVLSVVCPGAAGVRDVGGTVVLNRHDAVALTLTCAGPLDRIRCDATATGAGRTTRVVFCGR